MATPLNDQQIDDLCAQYGLVKHSRRQRLINSTPRVGQYFWVDFPHDAYAPEFVKEHPGVVIRAARKLNDTCIIVPITSTPQDAAKHIHKLQKNPNPNYPKREVWAVCDHLYTIHTARLRPVHDNRYRRVIYPYVSQSDMEAIYECIRHALPNVMAPPIQITTTTEVTETVITVGE